MRAIRSTGLLMLVSLIVLVAVFGCTRDYPEDNQVALNADLDHTVTFSLGKVQPYAATNVEGTIFIYGEPGTDQHARLVATFYIDQSDTHGFFIELHESMDLKSVDWDYGSNKEDAYVGLSGFKSESLTTIIWVANVKRYEVDDIGRGPGTLIVDFDFNENECTGGFGTKITIDMQYEHDPPSDVPVYLRVDLR